MEPLVHRPGGDPSAGGDPELVEDVLDVALCSSLRDHQLSGNLAIRKALRYQPCNLPLTRCEWICSPVTCEPRRPLGRDGFHRHQCVFDGLLWCHFCSTRPRHLEGCLFQGGPCGSHAPLIVSLVERQSVMTEGDTQRFRCPKHPGRLLVLSPGTMLGAYSEADHSSLPAVELRRCYTSTPCPGRADRSAAVTDGTGSSKGLRW